MSQQQKLPATRDPDATRPAETESREVPPAESPAVEGPPRQRISVAYLPFALITFVVLSLIAAAWTFFATAV